MSDLGGAGPAAGSGTLYAGTSGFAYGEWKGVFYPEGLPGREMLSWYARHLPSVEINYTFRRLPAEATVEGWRSQTPEGFRFTLKASQRITHVKRLNDVQEEVDEFVRRARLLGDRLGTILFQLPPNLRYERGRLETFLAALPPVCRYAVEFRHESWTDPEVTELLAANGVALCGADTEERLIDAVPVTAGHAYLRLRREGYGDEEIAEWAKRIGGVVAGGRDVYCYFKHEGGGIGPAYARALLEAAG